MNTERERTAPAGPREKADSLSSNPDLLGFAKAIFEATDWPTGGDLDGFAFQEIAEKYGLLKAETRTAPCLPEGCHCAEYYDPDEIVAFPGGKGTEDMVKTAQEFGYSVMRVAANG